MRNNLLKAFMWTLVLSIVVYVAGWIMKWLSEFILQWHYGLWFFFIGITVLMMRLLVFIERD